MESIFSRYKNALVLMLVVLAQVVLLAMQVRRPAPNMPDGHNVRLWRYWVAAVVTPPERLAHNVGLGLRGVWSNYIYLRHLREQNETLQAENDRLRLEQASLAEDARSGERLRAMLEFRGQYIDKTLPAQVIGTSGTDQAHVIYIDKGSNDGVRAQMPVITPDGVVGKIKNVFPGTAQVLLISDQTSGAGVMLQSTRIRGVMKGNALGEPQIVNISPDDRIKPGETILTSGGDQVYPMGLPVGVVDRVVAEPETSFVNVVVKPNANLAKLEEVLVIIQVSDKMPFSEEKDMMQSEVDAYADNARAADILADRLPSIRDAKIPEAALAGEPANESATSDGGDPARPMRPPQALHPDRYTPGSAPPALSLTPAQAPPGLHRDLSQSASESSTSPVAKPAAGSGNTNAASATDAPIVRSRFPVKPPPEAAVPLAASKPGTGAPMMSGATTSNAAASGVPSATSVAPKAPPNASKTAGSGFVLPLQPAVSAARRSVAATTTGAAEAQPVGRPLNSVSVTNSSGTGTGNTGAEPTTTRAPRPATTAVATDSAAGVRAAGSRPMTATPGATSHKIVIPGENSGSGILTPAGMGSLGTPRPRVTAAASKPATTGTGSGAGGSGTPSTESKPAAAKPASAASPAAPTTRPSTAPAKPSASRPPGGG